MCRDPNDATAAISVVVRLGALAILILGILWVIDDMDPGPALLEETSEVGVIEAVQDVNARDPYALVTVDGHAYMLDGDVDVPGVGEEIRYVADGNEMSEWTKEEHDRGW